MNTDVTDGRTWTQAQANEAARRALEEYVAKYPSRFVREMRRYGYSVDGLARAMRVDACAVRQLERTRLALVRGGMK